jgi:hypothetical protein
VPKLRPPSALESPGDDLLATARSHFDERLRGVHQDRPQIDFVMGIKVAPPAADRMGRIDLHEPRVAHIEPAEFHAPPPAEQLEIILSRLDRAIVAQ